MAYLWMPTKAIINGQQSRRVYTKVKGSPNFGEPFAKWAIDD
jgi:hypothetical protein